MLAKYYVVFFYLFQTVVDAADQRTAETKGEDTDSINSRLDALENILQTSFQKIVSKINQQQEILGKLTEIEQTNQKQLQNITIILANNSSQERCESKSGTSANTTPSPVVTIPSNESQPDDARLLNVTVPSSVRARPDAWAADQIPEEDDLDKFMKNATGCEYMARGYRSVLQPLHSSIAPGGTWRRRLAVRGAGNADIFVTWGAGHNYRFMFGYESNTETRVSDYTKHRQLLKRATPGVMSQDMYTKFYYIQLEDGVMTFGALGDNTPWLRHDVTVSTSDVEMLPQTKSHYGMKLLVCA